MMRILVGLLALALTAEPLVAADFGAERDRLLAQRSLELFGIAAPLENGASASAEEGYRTKDQAASDQVLLAPGLTAEYLTRSAANLYDQMAFWPTANPTHLIACIEGNREEIAPGKWNPSIQSVSLADGTVTTLVRGMSGCDGIRTTHWGTIVATEERADGGVYELVDPLSLKDAVVLDRGTGETSDAAHIAKRTKLPAMAWEGLHATAEGVIYGADELRPGTDKDGVDGGGLYKFIPRTVHSGGVIADLSQSPLVDGTTYALQIQCQASQIQFGEGCEVGKGAWIKVDPTKVRRETNKKGTTGFYRPEDLQADPSYRGPGVRICNANTGNESAGNFAEIMCTTDLAPGEAPQAGGDGKLVFSVSSNRFVEGDTEFNSFDNVAFQGTSGILYVLEDHPNGEIYACLPDGADRDIKSDGCIRILAVKDTSAEPTGFIFADDGMTAYLSVQHSEDSKMEKADGYDTDDLIKISGFKAPVGL